MSNTKSFSLSRRSLMLGAAATGFSAALHPYSVLAKEGTAHIRLMETTDLHVQVFPYDYYGDRPIDTAGLARTATLIRQIRNEATNSILVDNGDFLQGNPMGDFIAYERGMREGDVHPVIKGMNVLDFDAATLGNHEFNYGLDFMMKVLSGADFPVVCANLVKGTSLGANARSDDLFLKPYVILEKQIQDGAGNAHPIKIGFIGFVPPQIMNWDRRHLEGSANARDIVESAKAFVPEMREQGCDLVVALSHSGIDANDYAEGMENASLHLAAIDGIDAVFTGHHHLVFPGPAYEGLPGVDSEKGTLFGKPAAMGGFWGSHLGVIDLMVERDGNGWRIANFVTGARPIYEKDGRKSIPLVESQQDVLDAVKEDHEATLAYVRRPVGKTSAPLHSYFALVADDPSVQIVSKAQTWYIDQMLKGTEWEGLPILSAAAPFKAGGRGGPDYYTDVPVGDVAIKNVADLYLYPNTVRAVAIKGSTVKEWLERSAGIFLQVEPGKADQPLINSAFPSYNFDVIDGVTYEIDLSQPSKYGPKGELENESASRIVNLKFDGKPLDPEATFIVATNNYRAGGGGNFPGIGDDVVVFVGPDTNRDVLVRYIVEQGTINPSADANWTFKPMPETTVLFDTGPGGTSHVSTVEGVAIEPAGDGDDGFARYRIAL
ncbi:MAG: bifunctional 2',3'-cyclic-nucleotide 2'-phosphodiesterase/3'-nucleotidase [Roseibium sp.]|uniref:bifunctional 2',3'-cyclic-nucleotide 2'-phosphodiesterase/3'-nucleotidase n=1 Tax=Roseibium sp. TaxID=1936156 RepID=UPI001AFF9871|nr:bifunctional 2',3'-cyclic-nucleotide 2'-phosphodiesterase/3'-nucleotidase [Roseibium sp.]MBO6893295.1 bifunctional 2',3'-cyclic-nucleotide 2'-phosphodiesterase/3'-nucleotidase [Roseibium sp.]MBO6932204.1 bifunctional 2',3'-cyclic-nucleotide 2'-phosphodiesterase/3'-nucleotidase [Roseibium sp.]